MTKRQRLISKAPVARMLTKAGAERVSDAAADTFAEVLEEVGLEIAEQAARIAKHSGRKTILAGDIKLASKE